MGKSQYRRQHYITYQGCRYSLPSVAGFIGQSGDYYLFPPPEISGGQGSEKVNLDVDVDEKYERRRGASLPASSIIKDYYTII